MKILILDNMEYRVYFLEMRRFLGLKVEPLFYDFRKRFLRVNNQFHVVF